MVKEGKYTTEFYMALVGKAIAVIFPLLIAYGLIDDKQAELWIPVLLLIASIAIPWIVGKTDRTYIESRTAIKLEGMQLERAAAQLETARLEAMQE